MGKNTNGHARIRQAAEKKRKAKENKVFYTLLIITVSIVAVVILLKTISPLFASHDATINLNGIEDDWLVIDLNEQGAKRYHHPASFTAPEGYSLGKFSKYNDGVSRDFYYIADDPTNPVAVLYVDATAKLTAEQYLQNSIALNNSALGSGVSVTMGEPFSAVISGETAQCLYMHFSTPTGDYGSLLLGIDAPNDVCIIANISGADTTPENVQTQEQLLTAADNLLVGLTIIK